MNDKPLPSPPADSIDPTLDRDAATLCPGVNANSATADPSPTSALSATPSQTSPLTAGLATSSLQIPTGTKSFAFQKGRQFGDYELLDEIARGGMGVVFKAKQSKLNRIVALKMIIAGELASRASIERFFAEAEAAANLDHPGIVPIYEVGVCEGRQFFSMGFIDGGSLAERLANGPLPLKQAAQLMIEVAEAVHYAHEKGVVHRDLKPANILLARATGSSEFANPFSKLASSASKLKAKALAGDPFPTIPKITDFGLAKRTESTGSGNTATGEILGTPSYMPPEQAAGRIQEIGPLSDVYSLGALLYATVTGRPPFQAASVMDTLVQVLERDPIRPSALNPAVDRDLETICLKAMEKQPARRYASARDFADDLRRYLRHEPIVARRVSATGRALRWCRRNRLAATAFLVIGLLLLGVMVVGPAVAVREAILREAADEQRDIAEMLSREAALQSEEAQQQFLKTRRLLYGNQISLADREFSVGHVRQARLLIEKSEPDMRGWEWRFLENRLHGDEFWFNGHLTECRQIAFSADGRQLYSVGNDARFYVWDVREAKRAWSLDLAAPGQSLAVHPRTGTVVVLDQDGELIEVDWQRQDRKPLGWRLGENGKIVFNRAGSVLAFAPSAGAPRLYAWPLPTEKTAARFVEVTGFAGPARAMAFGSGDRQIAIAGDNGGLALHDANSGRPMRKLSGHFGSVHCVAFDPSGKRVASAGRDTSIRIWSTATGAPLATLHGSTYPIDSITFTHEADAIAAAGLDGSVRIWEVATGVERLTHRGHNRFARAVCLSPVDDLLASCSSEGDIRFWSSRLPRFPEKAAQMRSPIIGMELDSTGRFALVSCEDTRIRVVDTAARRIVGVLVPDAKPLAVWFESPPSDSISSADNAPAKVGNPPLPAPRDAMLALSVSGRLHRWASVDQPPKVEQFVDDMLAVASWSTDGLALATTRGAVYHAATAAEKPVLLATLDDWKPRALHVSKAAEIVAVGCQGATNGRGALILLKLGAAAAVQEANAAAVAKPAATFLNAASAVTVHAAQQWIAVGCDDTSLALLGFDGKRTHELTGHAAPISRLTFADDNERLVSTSADGAVKFWDVETKVEVLTLSPGGIGLAISKDDRRVVSGFWDLWVRTWTTTQRTEAERRDAMRIRSVWAEDCTAMPKLKKELLAAAGKDIARRRSIEIAFDALPQTPVELNAEAWRVVAYPAMPKAMYRNADRLAQQACRMVGERADRADCVNSAGVAKFRLGELAACVQLLNESDQLYRKRFGQSRAADLAFLVMAHRGLGAADKAQFYERQLRDLEAKNNPPLDAEARRFLAEVKQASASDE